MANRTSETNPRQQEAAPIGTASFANPESIASTEGAIKAKLSEIEVEKKFRLSTTTNNNVEQRAIAIPSTNRLVTFPHSGISIKSAPKITDEHEINTRAPNERENKSPMTVINQHNKMEHGNHNHLFSVVKF